MHDASRQNRILGENQISRRSSFLRFVEGGASDRFVECRFKCLKCGEDIVASLND
jgi:hypothetical protein